jgi:predicted HTH domain antitoxin
MTQTIPMEIPADWVEGLEGDPTLLMQELVQLGIHQFKVRRSVEMYRAGVGSLGYIAEKLNISKRDLILELRVRGIQPVFDEQTVKQELGE